MNDEWVPDIAERSGPVYEAIVDSLRRSIHSGHLRSGMRLPTHRRLAKALGISLGTVTKAYTEARKLGLINGEAGRGMFVASQSAVAKEGYPAPGESSGYIDLTLNQPAIDARSDALRQCFADLSQRPDLMRYLDYNLGPVDGRHLEAASAWIRIGGAIVPPENLLLCNGAQQALFAALLVYGRAGGVVATEVLNYPPLRHMAEMIGLRLVGVAVDRDGMIPDSLEEVCRQHEVRMVICTPRGHNPTTACLPLERRRRILDIADRYGLTLVEDDVYGAFYGSGVPTLYELSGGRTIYINSLSKCIAPGLRIGFLAAHPSMLSHLAHPIYNTTWCSPAILGEVFTNWMNMGAIKAMLHWHRREIRKRQLMAYWIFKDYDYRVSPGCYHMWLELPRHLTVEQVVIGARQVGLLLTHSSAFSITGAPAPNALRLSLGRPTTIRSLKHALKQLSELLINQSETHPLVI